MREIDFSSDLEIDRCSVLGDPTPPPGGGHLVLTPNQIGNWDLICAIKSTYPETKIIVSQPIPLR